MPWGLSIVETWENRLLIERVLEHLTLTGSPVAPSQMVPHNQDSPGGGLDISWTSH